MSTRPSRRARPSRLQDARPADARADAPAAVSNARPAVRQALRPACTVCGAAMRSAQEWCLECGAARTRVRRARGRRGPGIAAGAAIIVVTVVLGLAVDAIAQNGPPARTPATGVQTGRQKRSGDHLGGVAAWPAGLSGWTVVLARTRDASLAREAALGLAASGTSTGVLDSSAHPLLIPGAWVVFSGRYPSRALAARAAASLRAAGHPGTVVEVAAPGGI